MTKKRSSEILGDEMQEIFGQRLKKVFKIFLRG